MADRAGVERTTMFEFVTVTLIWGSTWLVIKGQLGVVPPVWSVTYRFLVAGIALAAFAAATGRWRWPPLAGHGFALISGVAQFVLNYNLVYLAETHLASGPVALVFALLIVPNTVLTAIFLKRPMTLRFAVGALLGVAGVFLLFARDLTEPGGAAAAAGLALVAVAVLCASVANVMQATSLAQSLPAMPTLALTMVYGGAIDAVYALATVGRPVFDPRPTYWLGLGYLSIGASVVAFTLYYRMIRRIGAGPAAYSSVLVPVVALFLSTLFEGYHLTPLAAAGAAVALVGLIVALGGRSKGTRAAPSDDQDRPAVRTPVAP